MTPAAPPLASSNVVAAADEAADPTNATADATATASTRLRALPERLAAQPLGNNADNTALICASPRPAIPRLTGGDRGIDLRRVQNDGSALGVSSADAGSGHRRQGHENDEGAQQLATRFRGSQSGARRYSALPMEPFPSYKTISCDDRSIGAHPKAVVGSFLRRPPTNPARPLGAGDGPTARGDPLGGIR
jgi:hypothetical protein